MHVPLCTKHTDAKEVRMLLDSLELELSVGAHNIQ